MGASFAGCGAASFADLHMVTPPPPCSSGGLAALAARVREAQNRLSKERELIVELLCGHLSAINTEALPGGVASKSHASLGTVFFIPEAPCLGD